MIANTILVVFLLTSRVDVQILYTAKFETQQQCESVAKTLTKHEIFASYPIQYAQCAKDITK